MVSKILVPSDYTLPSRTCECVTLRGKKNSADVFKDRL